MSLIGFHRVLIASAIVFCFGFAAWELVHFWVAGGTGALALGVVFLVLAVLLCVYLARLRRYGRGRRRHERAGWARERAVAFHEPRPGATHACTQSTSLLVMSELRWQAEVVLESSQPVPQYITTNVELTTFHLPL